MIKRQKGAFSMDAANENKQKKTALNIHPELNTLIEKAQQLNRNGIKELEKQADLLLLSDKYRKINLKEKAI